MMSEEIKMVTPLPRVNARKRAKNDFYVEPEWAVRGLLEVQRFSGLTLDPACGSGTIPHVFEAGGLSCHGSDIVDRCGGEFHVANFLEERRTAAVDNVVTNPPFDLAADFIRIALRLARHKVAILQRLSFMESGGRRWIFENTPLVAIHPFASRVSMPPGGKGIKAKGGAIAFAWYVWDHSHPEGAPPIVRRIEGVPDSYAPF